MADKLDAASRQARMLIWAAGLVLTLASWAALLALALYDRADTLKDGHTRGSLVARVLAEHTTRLVDTAALALSTVGDVLVQRSANEPERLQSMLGEVLIGMPFLRSVAVLDETGTVLYSSAPQERGLRLDMAALGRLPEAGRDTLLNYRPGRGLAALRAGGAAVAPRGVGVLPLLRQVRLPDGSRRLLLALINPDALANFQQIVLGDPGSAAAVASYGGQLIAATADISTEPGASVARHPVFASWLARREHEQFEGAGLRPGVQLVAYRTSATRPLVVMVEQSREVLLQSWRASLVWYVLLGMAVSLLSGLLCLGAARSLRARSAARAALDLAHQDVAARERELSVLMKSVQELIFRTDEQGLLSFVNARWMAFSRLPAAQILGTALADLVEPEHRDSVRALFAPEAGGLRHAAAAMRAQDGSLRRFEFAVVPLHGQGRLLGFAGSAVDVTARCDAQRRLQHQLEFSALLQEMSPLPVSMFDLQGRYQMVNQAWESFTGKRRAEVLGTRVGAFLSPADKALHETRDAELLQRGGRVRYEARVPDSHGQYRDMMISKVLVPDEHGGISGILCTLMDVSEFREAERATREARDAAEAASLAKSEFIANISHELRTPLQTIIGFSELGQMRGREQPKLLGMFNDIHAAGQRMLALVNDLLDVAKIESTVGTFHLERCDLRDLMRELEHELQPLLSRRRLQLQLAAGEVPLSARVDPQRIQQVLRNLLANAIKFSPEGGRIVLAGEFSSESEIHLSVADQGPGIPPDEVDQIFEAFVQSSQTKDGSGGTGLGLAICRKIVDVHGGRIAAANRPEGGALFHLWLPAKGWGDTLPMGDE
ncbi:ATP-binding protein [Paucibacter sp. APW11]|uniref:histidine kinase n=1 Tax=Roseateles aquae TaxID=3077235 RepID=A0ABU3PBV4_9BURK|nr:ATP-binding protein [Paucibacter sp. APW11]MDT9000041.1 ATP-binding protein [Paucibacter sp. APW11]